MFIQRSSSSTVSSYQINGLLVTALLLVYIQGNGMELLPSSLQGVMTVSEYKLQYNEWKKILFLL